MIDLDRISVDAPASDASRDRIESRVFARLDAIRAAERAGRLSADRPSPARWRVLALAGAAAVALASAVLGWPSLHSGSATAPSLVVTPVGGSSRFTVDDAVIDAGSDTEVEVHTGDASGVTFVLGRGTIDCDVAPRRGRPLRVRAGDVIVEVIGTRFAVTRGAAVRVDVTHGRVRVRARGREFLIGPGERWVEGEMAPGNGVGVGGALGTGSAGAETMGSDAMGTAEAPIGGSTADRSVGPRSDSDDPGVPSAGTRQKPLPPSIPDDSPDAVPRDAEIELPDEAAPPAHKPTRRSSRAEFESAQRLESRARGSAVQAYRAVADGEGAWAALALYSLAELDVARGDHRGALAAVAEYVRRFPRGAGLEDMLWIRVETLRALSRSDDARAAAVRYLQRFPNGTYAKPAARIAAPP